ncbi:CRAL-TRIO domain-containing protein C23B6.04c [Pseudocercospora fuligena]|uniref:CRAL-TRIO domain-containing protein C23B6.04c n=1 Tax=Pseudocercospora fuligena TaxID=685502 RepID=A0A8H6VK30_9PEZI|nr:CRAL-TRIO domain-containing protein C23B6.04c [Pseudocercospora fuligena]
MAASFQSTSETPASSAIDTSAGAGREVEDWLPPTTGPQKTPIPRPAATSKPSTPAQLTPEQKTKYSTVLAQVSEWQAVPTSTAKGAPDAPLKDHERMFLTRECILRYLRATKWNTKDALSRLQGTLSWRREYGADTFTHDYISPENETGKQIQLGFDKDQRPCLYLSPGRQNTKMSDRQIHHLCYMVDRTIDMMPPGVETNCLIINFKNSKSGNIPTVGQARAVLNILQTHNPERLGKALIRETPWYVNAFFKLISAFIDPVTKEKMKFNEDMTNYIPKTQLWDEHGGDVKFEYDHAVYWPAFGEACTTRREAYKKRWEEGGKRIGEHEDYLRGGNAQSLQQQQQNAAKENAPPVGSTAATPAVEKSADEAAAGIDNLKV